MDRTEARVLLERELRGWKERSWGELRATMGDVAVVEVTGPTGVLYQIEIESIWDSEPEGMIRVFGSIDDGRFLSILLPVSDSFLVGPDGMLGGETMPPVVPPPSPS